MLPSPRPPHVHSLILRWPLLRQLAFVGQAVQRCQRGKKQESKPTKHGDNLQWIESRGHNPQSLFWKTYTTLSRIVLFNYSPSPTLQ